MRLEIIARGIELSNALRQHAERRVAFALSRFDDAVTAVTVRLRDVNGPRGGVDKEATIDAVFRDGERARVEQLASSLEAAIDRAADRIGRIAGRRVNRRGWRNR